MSWVRSAVNKAVEGGQSNIGRAVRYADSVVLHASNAVAGGARIIQDRIVARNMQSFKHTVKRLEEVSVSCRGIERVQLLRRWLVALREVERLTTTCSNTNAKYQDNEFLHDESKDSSTPQPTLIYYVDPGAEGELKDFRDVFLSSLALEGITLSLILDAPNEEEVSLLSEIYGLCIKGGKEEHTTLLSTVQDLAKAFSGYKDEVLTKREELLQYVRSAISGLKINADFMRIEVEACNLKENIENMKAVNEDGNFVNSPKVTSLAIKALDEAMVKIQMCCKLEELLLKKKYFSYGDSPQLHAEKVEKLKVLSESLANSAKRAEVRISENRYQKEEALHFRATKSKEVSQIEKELSMEIGELEKQKDELEDRLKKVNNLLTSARMRLHNAKEEKEQFDEASNDIIVLLKTKEDEMMRAITSCSVEANVVDTWIKFLESTWIFQTSHKKLKEEQVNAELERYGDHFVNLVVHLLYSYEEKLGLSITQIRILVENLRSNQGLAISSVADNEGKLVNPRIKLEEEYLDIESKILATLNIVDTMKKQFHIQKEGIFRKDMDKVTELFDAIEKIRGEFESIERPKLELENPTERSETPLSQTSSIIPSPPTMAIKHKKDGVTNPPSITGRSQIEIELDKLSEDDSSEEICEWEFDALDKDRHFR